MNGVQLGSRVPGAVEKATSLTLQAAGLPIALSALSSVLSPSHNPQDDRFIKAWICLWLHVTTSPLHFCLLLSVDVNSERGAALYLFFKLHDYTQ